MYEGQGAQRAKTQYRTATTRSRSYQNATAEQVSKNEEHRRPGRPPEDGRSPRDGNLETPKAVKRRDRNLTGQETVQLVGEGGWECNRDKVPITFEPATR